MARNLIPTGGLPDLDFGDDVGGSPSTDFRDVGTDIDIDDLPNLQFNTLPPVGNRNSGDPSPVASEPFADREAGSLAPVLPESLPDLDFGEDLPPPPAPADIWKGRSLRTPISELEGGDEYEKLLEEQLFGEKRGFREAVSDVDKGATPFAGDIFTLMEIKGIGDTARRITENEDVSDQELLNFNTYLLDQERKQEASILGKAGDVVRESATFGAELAIIAGLGSVTGGVALAGGAGKKITAKASLRAAKAIALRNISKFLIKKVGPKAAVRSARVLVRGAELNLAAAAFDVLRFGSIPRAFEERKLNNILTGTDEDAQDAFINSMLSMHIEHFSELTGGDLGRIAGRLLPGKMKRRMARTAIGQFVANKFDNPTAKAISEFAKTAGYNGMLQEMGEERVGDFLRGLFGVEGDAGLLNAIERSIPSLDQLGVETIAFAIPGVAFAGVNAIGGARQSKVGTTDEARAQVAAAAEEAAQGSLGDPVDVPGGEQFNKVKDLAASFRDRVGTGIAMEGLRTQIAEAERVGDYAKLELLESQFNAAEERQQDRTAASQRPSSSLIPTQTTQAADAPAAAAEAPLGTAEKPFTMSAVNSDTGEVFPGVNSVPSENPVQNTEDLAVGNAVTVTLPTGQVITGTVSKSLGRVTHVKLDSGQSISRTPVTVAAQSDGRQFDTNVNQGRLTGADLVFGFNEETGLVETISAVTGAGGLTATLGFPTADTAATQDEAKVRDLATRIVDGEDITTPEDLQTQANFPEELEQQILSIAGLAPAQVDETARKSETAATIEAAEPESQLVGGSTESPSAEINEEALQELVRSKSVTKTIKLYESLDPSNREAWEALAAGITFQDMVDDPNNSMTQERAEAARANAGIADNVPLDELTVHGSNVQQTTDGVVVDVIKIASGTDLSTVVEERAEAVLKQWLNQDRVGNAKILSEERRRWHKAAGTKASDQSDLEWFSDRAIDFAVVKQIQRKAEVKGSIRRLLVGIKGYADDIIRRAAEFRRLLRGGQISPRLAILLDSAVLQERIQSGTIDIEGGTQNESTAERAQAISPAQEPDSAQRPAEGTKKAQPSPAQTKARQELARRGQPADLNEASLRAFARDIDAPASSDPLFKEIKKAIPGWRFKSAKRTKADGLRKTWEDVLKEGKSLGLIPDDATEPETLTSFLNGRQKTIGQLESEVDQGMENAAESAVHEEMTDLVKSGILPSEDLVESYPDVFAKVLRRAKVEAVDLVPEQEPTDATDFNSGFNALAAEATSAAPETGKKTTREQVEPEDILGDLSGKSQQSRREVAAQQEAEDRFLGLLEGDEDVDFQVRVTPEQDAAYQKAVDSVDNETAKKLSDQAYASTSETFDVLLDGRRDTVEVVRNPSSRDYQRIAAKFKREFPDAPKGEIKSRSTHDGMGNTFIWYSSDAVHASMEPSIERMIGRPVSQTNDEAHASIIRDEDGNVIPLSQRFDETIDDINFQVRQTDFKSPMLSTFEAKLPGTVTGKQLVDLINSWQKKGELKKSEIEDSEIIEWAKQQGKLSKEDVLGQVAAMTTTFEETTLKDIGPQEISPELNLKLDEMGVYPETTQDWIDTSQNIEDEARQYQQEGNEQQAATHFELSEEAGRFAEGIVDGTTAGTTKFGEYTLPGGKNYREILIKVPESQKLIHLTRLAQPYLNSLPNAESRQIAESMLNARKGDLTNGTFDDEWRQIEALAPGLDHNAIHRIRDEVEETAGDRTFQSDHFGDENILYHLRLDDRISPAGEKILFVEEIQSDWHQAGRRRGYNKNLTPELEAEGNTLYTERNKIRNSDLWIDGDFATRRRMDAINQRLVEITDLANPSGVPEAPFKKNWHELAIKRVLLEAIDGGYDAIGWTTGQQQADRFDLSKVLNEVQASKTVDGNYFIRATDKQGKEVLEDIYTVPDLPGVVGKDLANKIIAETPEGTVPGRAFAKSFTGLDLKVGGEGMKGFYDKILPSFVNKYTKKWGGRVGETGIDTGQNGILPESIGEISNRMFGRETFTLSEEEAVQVNLEVKRQEIESANDTIIHALPITDQMEEAIAEEPQPTYQVRATDLDVDGIPAQQQDAPRDKAPKARRTTGKKTKKATKPKKKEAPDAQKKAKPTQPTAASRKQTQRRRDLSAKSWTGRLRRAKQALRSSNAIPKVALPQWEAVDIDPAFGETTEFKMAAAELKGAGMTAAPVTNAPFNGAVVGNTVFLQKNDVPASAIAQHEIFHRMAAADVQSRSAQELVDQIDTKTEAFAQYQAISAAAYRRSRLRQLSPVEVREEMAADFFAGIEEARNAETGEKVTIADAIVDLIEAEDIRRNMQDGIVADALKGPRTSVSDLVKLSVADVEKTLHPVGGTSQAAIKSLAKKLDDVVVKGGISPKKRKRAMRAAYNVNRQQQEATLENTYRKGSIDKSLVALDAAMKNQRLDIYEKQRLLRQFTTTHLPMAERGKVMTQIERIADAERASTRQGRFDKSIDIISKAATKSERENLRRELQKEMETERIRLRRFAGKGKNTRTLETNRKMADFIESMTVASPQKIARINKQLEFLQQSGEEMSDALRDNVAKLTMPNIFQMTPDQLRGALEDIRLIRLEGKTRHDIEEAANEAKRNTNIALSIQEVRKVAEEDDETKARAALSRGGAKSKLKRIGDLGRNYGWSHLRPERIIEWFSGFKQNSVFKRVIFDRMLKAQEDKLVGTAKTLDVFKKIHASLNIGQAQTMPIMTIELEDGPVDITLDQAMFIYANSKNDGNRAHLIGTGFNEDVIDDVIEKMPDAAKRAVDLQIQYYDSVQYKRVSEIFAREHGVDMPKEEFYFPIQNLDTNRAENSIMADLLARHGARVSLRKGQTKGRIISRAAFKKMSYFETVIHNGLQNEHYIAYNDAVRDVNKFLNNPAMKAAMNSRSEEATRQMQDWLKAVAFGKIAASEQTIDRISDFLRTNYVTSVLGFNLITTLKQPASFFQGMRQIDKGEVASAAFKFLQNPREMMKFVKEASVPMANRANNIEREMAEIVEKGQLKKALGTQNAFEKFREQSMKPIQVADGITTTILWYAKYQEVINSGQSREAAITKADEVIRKTQPTGGLVNLAKIYRAGGIARAYTMFTNQLNQNANLVFETAANYRGIGSTIQDMAFYMLIPSMMIFMASNGGEPPTSDLKGWAKAFVSNLTGGLMFFNKLADATMMALTGERRGAQFLLDLTPSSLSAVEDLLQATSSADPNKGLQAIAKLSGVPFAQFKRTYKGVSSFKDTRDPRYLIWSKFALEKNNRSKR